MSDSGYTHCSCRDCMDVCLTADDGGWTLCWECLDAGCTPWPGYREFQPIGFSDIPASDYGCQRSDAYEG